MPTEKKSVAVKEEVIAAVNSDAEVAYKHVLMKDLTKEQLDACKFLPFRFKENVNKRTGFTSVSAKLILIDRVLELSPNSKDVIIDSLYFNTIKLIWGLTDYENAASRLVPVRFFKSKYDNGTVYYYWEALLARGKRVSAQFTNEELENYKIRLAKGLLKDTEKINFVYNEKPSDAPVDATENLGSNDIEL